MSEQVTADNFIAWLAKETRTLTQKTSADGDLFPYLWSIAVDALDWLRYASSDEGDRVLSSINQILHTGSSEDVSLPLDEREADCFVTLLGWIVNPPLVL